MLNVQTITLRYITSYYTTLYYWLETLIELKVIFSSFLGLSSDRKQTSDSLSSNSSRRYLNQQYPPPLLGDLMLFNVCYLSIKLQCQFQTLKYIGTMFCICVPSSPPLKVGGFVDEKAVGRVVIYYDIVQDNITYYHTHTHTHTCVYTSARARAPSTQS